MFRERGGRGSQLADAKHDPASSQVFAVAAARTCLASIRRVPSQAVQRWFGGLLAAALVFGGLPRAAAQPEHAPARPSDAPLPSCLDQTIRDQLGAELKPRGVQKRDFAKNKKIVLAARGGLYSGDLTSSSWIAGGALDYFFTEDLGIEASFDVTPLTLDLDSPLAQFFGDTRFEPGTAYLALGNLVWSPIHAKLKIGGGIVHADVMVFAGGGRMFHDAVQGFSLDGGFALDLFVTKLMTIRIDVRDLMAVQEIAGETRYTNNLISTAGIAFWIPSGL
jgi:outer membrane beta-barrel protein